MLQGTRRGLRSLAVVWLSTAAFPVAAATQATDVDLPSSAASGGTLALRVYAPGNAGESRFAEGAPVVVYVPGGFAEGSLQEPLRGASDLIRISFLFPGGRDGATGRASAGTYDQRGEQCIWATRDVARWAAGLSRDSRGRSIDDVLPVAVLHDGVGLIGTSNGGNLVAVAAADSALAGRLRWVVQWESPVSSQVVVSDAGRRFDCSTGRGVGIRSVNPYYRGYGALEFDIDYSRISYDPASTDTPVFLDGDGDGHYTTVVDASGCRSPDVNRNGGIDAFEDFPLEAITVASRRAYSRPATRALAAARAFGSSWPAGIATASEAEAAWDLREAVRWCAAASAAVPGLAAMLLASVEDHVQVVPGNHIRQAFECWQGAGAWVRINPGLGYLTAAWPAAGGAGLPENAPGAAPRDWSDVPSWAVPETVPTEALQVAAVHEMADRARGTR